MPHTSRHAKLDSPTARKKLAPRHAPYWSLISESCSVGYRRPSATRAGTWLAKYSPTDGGRRVQKKLGAADDLLPADGVICLSFDQAKAQAKDWFPVAAHLSTGAVPRRRKYTVEDAANDYLEKAKLHNTSAGFAVTNCTVKKNIIERLGPIPVEKITRAQIENWLGELVAKPRRTPAHGLDPNSEEAIRRRKETANRNLANLKAILNLALTDEKAACSGLAWKLVKPFKGVTSARTRFLNDEEAQKLVRACPPDFRLLVQGALFSGARYGELTRLRVCDFDSASGTLLITQSKSGKPRRVYLDGEAVQFFTTICFRRPSDDLIFKRDSGEPWGRNSAKRLMVEIATEAKISRISFHELRHSAASRWARCGLSLAEIAAQLGHADVRMTQRYAHLCKDTLAQKIQSLSPAGIFQAEEQHFDETLVLQ